MPPSTAHPEDLPDIPTLRRLTQSLAMLDAIISPEWECRYYSFNSKWSAGLQMASMCDGSGDDWFLLFSNSGAAIKGFAHESSLAKDASFPARIQNIVPADFKDFLNESAFSMRHATFCFWRKHADSVWSVVMPASGLASPDRDGSAELIGILDGDPKTYHVWAEDYYERGISLKGIEAVYAQEPLSAELVAALNPDIALTDVNADAVEIGYPV